MLSLPTPEDFGAIGDGVTNDWSALDGFFNSWAVSNLNDAIALALTPRKVYAFDQPLIVTCGTKRANFKLRLYGNGASLKYSGGAGNGYSLRMGDRAAKKKGFYCHISDFFL